MAEVGVHEAKTHFSKLLKRVEAGEEIVITRNREVIARLVPPADVPPRRLVWGTAEGQFTVPDDFDDPDPLDDEWLDELYGPST